MMPLKSFSVLLLPGGGVPEGGGGRRIHKLLIFNCKVCLPPRFSIGKVATDL